MPRKSRIFTYAMAQDIGAVRQAKSTLRRLALAFGYVPRPRTTGWLRFSHILSQLPEVLQRFNDGYRLFASSFSFEKVRDQLEGLRIEYTGKIHKTISDIQGQLLGIPVATIVVATQMKETSAIGAQMWSNLAVLVGSFIFSLLLGASIFNQFQTLFVLEQEVKRHEAATRNEHADIALRFRDVFDQLHGRIFWQGVILKVVLGIGALAFITSIVAFWVLTKNALSAFVA